MGEIENFDNKIEVIKKELEETFNNVTYIKSEQNLSKRHIYNCDNSIIMVDNYKRVYEIIGKNQKVLLGIKMDV